MADYIFEQGESVPTTTTQRFDANLEAIRLLRRLQEEGREATPAEQRVLARYSGFGDAGFSKVFPANRNYSDLNVERAWQGRIDELADLLSEQEMDSLYRSRINAHYTTPEVVQAMWAGLRGMGVDNLPEVRVLEPSAGSGRFLGYMPQDIEAKSRKTAAELDETTYQILRRAYPDTTVYGPDRSGLVPRGFEAAPIPDNSQDVVISNVPFSETGLPIPDPAYPGILQQRLHNYFFVKGMDKLRPGGVMAYITSRGTMDANDPHGKRVREWLADRADLVSAVRLPEGAFPDTDVVTDVIFLRKRAEGEEPGDRSWVDASSVEIPDGQGNDVAFTVNQHYINNPGSILGREAATGSMYGGKEYNVELPTGEKFRPEMLRRNLVTDAGEAPAIPSRPVIMAAERAAAEPTSTLREGEFLRGADGKVKVVQGGREVDAGLNTENAAKVLAMSELATRARALLTAESAGESDEVVDPMRAELLAEYEAFKDAHGIINAPANYRLMRKHPEFPLIRALERAQEVGQRQAVDKKGKPVVAGRGEPLIDDQGDIVTDASGKPVLNKEGTPVMEAVVEYFPATVLERRVLGQVRTPKIETPSEAMWASLNNSGRLDFDQMGEWVGQSGRQIRDGLAADGQVFLNPETGGWETRDKYLSGNVREKLKLAQQVAAQDNRYDINVAELSDAMPERVTSDVITASFGAAWIPGDIMTQWARDNMDMEGGEIVWSDEAEAWVINEGVRRTRSGGEASALEFGYRANDFATPEKSPLAILEYALEGKRPSIRVNNKYSPEASSAAQAKIDELRESFNDWVWEKPERAEYMEDLYNDRVANIRAKSYSHDHLTFPGMAEEWAGNPAEDKEGILRPHQKEAIARGVQEGTVLLAHEVGFGKTAVMVATGMERKRLGLSEKPLYVVPRNTYRQFVSQFYDLYPGARLIYPDDDDFNEANRRDFLARVRTGDWDGVVMTYEQFEKIPVSPDVELGWYRDRLANVQAALEQAIENNPGKKKSIAQKALEKRKIRIENRIAQAIKRREDSKTKGRDEQAEYFDTLGVDQLFVDEAHNFKNLGYETFAFSDANIKGLPNTDAMRANDMFLKTQILRGTLGTEATAGMRAKRAQDAEEGRFATSGVVFATGTPAANTIAEIWTMLRYLHLEELSKRNMQQFDSWARSHGRVVSKVAQTTGGNYREEQRFAKFQDVPELSMLLQDVADIRVRGETPEMLKEQPRLIDDQGQPTDNRIRVKSPSTAAIRAYQRHLAERSEEIKRNPQMDPRLDNNLTVLDDGRKASLDLRMVVWPGPLEDPETGQVFTEPEPNPDGKIFAVAKKVAEIHRQEAADRGTQMIFLDRGTPSDGDNVRITARDELLTQLDPRWLEKKQQTLSNAYGLIKDELVRRGVPASDIAFVHDYDTPEGKHRLNQMVNDGQIRVVLGSTQKLGTGINMQTRLAAVHHVDAPWRPADVEQREGRIIRPGNKAYGPVMGYNEEGKWVPLEPGKGARIYSYVQEHSTDGLIWNAIGAKQSGIKQIVRRDVTEREVAEADDLAADASVMAAVASGNPMALDMAVKENEVAQMRLKKRAYDRSISNARQNMRMAKNLADQLERELPLMQSDGQAGAEAIERAKAVQGFVGAEADGVQYDKREDANNALASALGGIGYRSEWTKVGEYLGWDIMGSFRNGGIVVGVTGPSGEVYQAGSKPELRYSLKGPDWVRRAENTIGGLQSKAVQDAGLLSNQYERMKAAQRTLDKKFTDGDKLEDAEQVLYGLRAVVLGQEQANRMANAERVRAATQQGTLVQEREVEDTADTVSDDDLYAQASDEEKDAAIALVQSSLMDRMAREGRQFTMPTQADIEAEAGRRVVEVKRQERRDLAQAAAQEAKERAEREEGARQEQIIQALSAAQREYADTGEGPSVTGMSAADIVSGRLTDRAERGQDTSIKAEDIGSGTVAEVAQDLATDLEDAPGPVLVAVDGDAQGSQDAVVVAAIEPVDDLSAYDKDELIERTGDWVSDTLAGRAEENPDGVAVIGVDETQGMILQSVRDELAERGDAPDAENDTVAEVAQAVVDDLAESTDSTPADTDYAGDGDDEADTYIDVDGAMVPERAPATPEPAFMPLVTVSSTRAGIIDRMAELVAEREAVQNANANSPHNLDIEINKQIKQVATESLRKHREDKDFVEFYNSLGSDGSILKEIREKVHGNLEGESAADLAVSADTVPEETLSDRIRNFGDTGFVDPDDYETLMDTGFDGDIAAADSLEELEVLQETDYRDNAGQVQPPVMAVAALEDETPPESVPATPLTPEERIDDDLGEYTGPAPVSVDTDYGIKADMPVSEPPRTRKGTNRSALIHAVTKGDYALLSDVQDQIEPQVIERALKAGVIVEGVNDAGEKVLVYAKKLTDRDRRKQAEIQQAVKAEQDVLDNADQWNQAAETLAEMEGHSYIPVVSDEARESGVDRDAIEARIEAKYDKLWDPRKQAEPEEQPYYYREMDTDTGEVTTHVEAATPEQAAEVLEDLGPSPADDAPSVTQVDIDVATGETEVTITESPADDLDDDEAEVLEAVADGVVTPAEAEEAKSEAGRILAEVAQDTPDSPAPRRAYDSKNEISARIRELCDDPDELQELLARARADAAEAAAETQMARRNRGDGDGDGNTVSEAAVEAAAEVLAQARKNAPDKPRTEPNKVRQSDLELLQAVMEDCDTEDLAGPVRLEVASFLAEKGGTPIDVSADLSAVAVAEKPASGKKGGKTPKSNPAPSASTKTKARARQRHPFLRGKEARK